MINKGLTDYEKVKNSVQNALSDSNFKCMLKYSENKNSQIKRKSNQPSKIIYFNPSFCQSVKTNLWKIFFQLIDKHLKTMKYSTKL